MLHYKMYTRVLFDRVRYERTERTPEIQQYLTNPPRHLLCARTCAKTLGLFIFIFFFLGIFPVSRRVVRSECSRLKQISMFFPPPLIVYDLIILKLIDSEHYIGLTSMSIDNKFSSTLVGKQEIDDKHFNFKPTLYSRMDINELKVKVSLILNKFYFTLLFFKFIF